MKSDTVKHLGDGAFFAAVATGGGAAANSWFQWVNSNAGAIGVILSIIFGVIGIIFHWLNHKRREEVETNAEEIRRLKEQIKGLSDRKGDK